jgi:uncharacterized protein
MFKFPFRGRKARQAALPSAPATMSPTKEVPPMSSEGIHVPYEKLPRETLQLHYANMSMREELEAADLYRQRAADTDDKALKAIFLHNANEEIEHFSMLLEWVRRNDPQFDKQLHDYLFSEGPITEVENKAMGRK